MPFREAHRIAGAAVRRAEALGVGLRGLSLDEYRALSPAFGADVHEEIRLEKALADKDVVGGTAPRRVREEIARRKADLASLEDGREPGRPEI